MTGCLTVGKGCLAQKNKGALHPLVESPLPGLSLVQNHSLYAEKEKGATFLTKHCTHYFNLNLNYEKIKFSDCKDEDNLCNIKI